VVMVTAITRLAVETAAAATAPIPGFSGAAIAAAMVLAKARRTARAASWTVVSPLQRLSAVTAYATAARGAAAVQAIAASRPRPRKVCARTASTTTATAPLTQTTFPTAAPSPVPCPARHAASTGIAARTSAWVRTAGPVGDTTRLGGGLSGLGPAKSARDESRSRAAQPSNSVNPKKRIGGKDAPPDTGGQGGVASLVVLLREPAGSLATDECGDHSLRCGGAGPAVAPSPGSFRGLASLELPPLTRGRSMHHRRCEIGQRTIQDHPENSGPIVKGVTYRAAAPMHTSSHHYRMR
jgi:hypothetical protein